MPSSDALLWRSDDAIIATILAHEGSVYTNDKADSGGPTRYGITLANLTSWRGQPCTADDVRQLTKAEAEAIYRGQYIRPFDTLPEPLRINVIDMGVNAGVGRATKLLQQMVGTDVDGWIGTETLKAITSGVDWNALYCGFRLAFYEDLILARPKDRKFRNGWRRRALSFLKA